MRLTLPMPLAKNESFRTELRELFKKNGYVLTWESLTEAWIHDISSVPEIEDYLAK